MFLSQIQSFLRQYLFLFSNYFRGGRIIIKQKATKCRIVIPEEGYVSQFILYSDIVPFVELNNNQLTWLLPVIGVNSSEKLSIFDKFTMSMLSRRKKTHAEDVNTRHWRNKRPMTVAVGVTDVSDSSVEYNILVRVYVHHWVR